MRKISNDDNFENYLNKYVNIEINGTVKKFFVTEVNSNSFVTNAGILRNYNTLGESLNQDCNVCEDPCYNSIPIIELNFTGGQYVNAYGSYLLDNKVNETHDVYLNSHKICRINTSVLSAEFNRLWLIPSNNINIQTPNFFDDSYTASIWTRAASCVFFNPTYYNYRNWNSLSIHPVSANNPNTLGEPNQTFFTNFYNDIAGDYSLYRRVPNVLTNKILSDSLGVSSVSCIPWMQYDLNLLEYGLACFCTGCYYLSTDLVSFSYAQPVSTFFIDLDPCQNPTDYGLGFTYDGTRYYTNTSIFIKEAYEYENPPDFYFGAPSLVKYVFYTDCLKSNTIELYYGISNVPLEGKVWYSDLLLNRYTGYFYKTEVGNNDITEVEVVNGIAINSNICP